MQNAQNKHNQMLSKQNNRVNNMSIILNTTIQQSTLYAAFINKITIFIGLIFTNHKTNISYLLVYKTKQLFINFPLNTYDIIHTQMYLTGKQSQYHLNFRRINVSGE